MTARGGGTPRYRYSFFIVPHRCVLLTEAVRLYES